MSDTIEVTVYTIRTDTEEISEVISETHRSPEGMLLIPAVLVQPRMLIDYQTFKIATEDWGMTDYVLNEENATSKKVRLE